MNSIIYSRGPQIKARGWNPANRIILYGLEESILKGLNKTKQNKTLQRIWDRDPMQPAKPRIFAI